MGDRQELPRAALATSKGMDWLSTTPPVASPARLDPTELPAPPSTFADRFALARRDPEFATAIASQVAAPSGEQALSLLGALGMVAFGVFFASLWLGGAPAEMVPIGVIFMVIWLGTAGRGALRAWGTFAAPQRAELACIRSRETLALRRGRRHESDADLQHRVTLELEDGRRLSLQGTDAIIGPLTEDDLGIAYVKGDRLIGFRRLAA